MSDRRKVNHGTAKQRMGLNDHDKDDRRAASVSTGEGAREWLREYVDTADLEGDGQFVYWPADDGSFYEISVEGALPLLDAYAAHRTTELERQVTELQNKIKQLEGGIDKRTRY